MLGGAGLCWVLPGVKGDAWAKGPLVHWTLCDQNEASVNHWTFVVKQQRAVCGELLDGVRCDPMGRLRNFSRVFRLLTICELMNGLWANGQFGNFWMFVP